MLKTLRKLERTDGAEIAEAALVLPLVFMFLLGIIWFGRAFQIYSTITQAAQQGAIVAARNTCATCGNNFSRDSDVDAAVNAVMNAANLDTNQILPSASGAATSCQPPEPPKQCSPILSKITICRGVVLNSPVGPNSTAQCGVTVGFKYPFQFFLPFTSLNLQQVTLTASAGSRMEN